MFKWANKVVLMNNELVRLLYCVGLVHKVLLVLDNKILMSMSSLKPE